MPILAVAVFLATLAAGALLIFVKESSPAPTTVSSRGEPEPAESRAAQTATPETPDPEPGRQAATKPSGRPVVLLKGDIRTETIAKPGKTVRQILASAGIKHGKDDKVKPGLKTVPAPGTVIRVKSAPARPGVRPEVARLNWAGLAQCESGGRVDAVNPAGYYGLYQFNLTSWRSVGGTKTPVDWGEEEQTYRAQLLYQKVGGNWRGQWPHCGRHLGAP